MPFEYASVPAATGDNAGGLKSKVYFAPERAFDEIQIPELDSTPGDTVKITLSHTFQSGEGFVSLDCVVDEGDLKVGIVGDAESATKKQELTIHMRGNTEEIEEFSRNVKNERGIFIIETTNGKKIQIGQKDLFATCMPENGTGTLKSPKSMYTFKIEAYANYTAFYSASITLK
jgi:hypothetical protein